MSITKFLEEKKYFVDIISLLRRERTFVTTQNEIDAK